MYLVLIVPRIIGNAINSEIYFNHISPCELDSKSRLLLTSINITIIKSPEYK